MTDRVILVNAHDEEVGIMEKMEAHRRGVLHRALSVLLFNSKGEILLQKRSASKYHSAGLWTNTCCSHPKPNELIEAAVERRLQEEMGIKAECTFAFKFVYEKAMDNDLIEHELDHVFTGLFDGIPVINLEEVEDWKFISMENLKEEIARHPEKFTFWFKLIVDHPKFLQRAVYK